MPIQSPPVTAIAVLSIEQSWTCNRGLVTPLWNCALAGHDADGFAVAPGGQGLAPGHALAIAEHGHAVDGVDKGTVVAQQNMTHALLIKAGQVELGSRLSSPGGWLTHTSLSPFSVEGKRGTIQIPVLKR